MAKTTAENNIEVLTTLLQPTEVSDKIALEVPIVARCINMIAAAVASLPIKLYRQTENGVEEITEDRRLVILNGDTGDTLNADYMRAAWVRDYLLNGAAYAYIETQGGKPDKLFYVKHNAVGRIIDEVDPIHKSYVYNIGGKTVYPYEMLKILHNSDGYGGGEGIVDENAEIISTAYNLIKYQKRQITRGGGKRGILRTQALNKDFLKELKAKWARLWTSTDDSDTMMVVNSQDVDFKELSSTAVDMQLNETQKTIDDEIMKLFGTLDGILSDDTVKNAVMPVIDAIEAALDSDLLLEREKPDHYFAFDTRELTRGDINTRYAAYATALNQNFLQLDEVRAMEDLPPLGVNFVKLGLNDVLLDPTTGTIYTPNTNAYAKMGENVQVPVDGDAPNGGELNV